MTYRFETECPKCGTVGESTSEYTEPEIHCGDCLMNHTEVVRLTLRRMPEDVFMVVTRTYPGGWCRDEDEKKALRRLRSDWRQQIEDYGFAVYLAHPETYCDGVSGNFVHPVGRPPKLVHTQDGKKTKAALAKKQAL